MKTNQFAKLTDSNLEAHARTWAALSSHELNRKKDLELFISRKGAGTLITTPEGRELLEEIAQ